jgi:hypothetical protein
MNIVKSFKQGECGVMRCQSPSVVLVEGTPFGREGVQVPLCERHSKGDMTQATPTEPMPSSTAVIDAVRETVGTQLAVQAEAEDEVGVAREALTEIQGLPITSDADLAFAAEILGEVKGHYNRLEERKKQATGPLNAALATIRSWFKPAQDHYAAAEKTLKEKIAAYHTLRAQERQAALDAAAAAHSAGDSAATQIAIAAVPPAPPKIDGVSVREEWTYEVVAFGLVPEKFKVINHAVLLAAVKETKGFTNIPGIRPVLVNKVVARAT